MKKNKLILIASLFRELLNSFEHGGLTVTILGKKPYLKTGKFLSSTYTDHGMYNNRGETDLYSFYDN